MLINYPMIKYPVLLEQLKAYYPIDQEQPYRDDGPPADWYLITEEYAKLRQVIAASNSEEVREKFSSFVNQLQQKLGLPSRITSSMEAPSNSVVFELERKETEDILIVREIYCYVSELVPYFIVYGVNNIAEKKSPFNLDMQGNARSMLYPSVIVNKPVASFEQPMNTIIQEAQTAYGGHEFLPWRIAEAPVPGLYHSGVADFNLRTIYDFLFFPVGIRYWYYLR